MAHCLARLDSNSLLTFSRYAIRNEIPFVRALKSVPQEMRDRMSPQHTRDLSIQACYSLVSAMYWTDRIQVMPANEDIHETVNQLVTMYSREYNVVFPPLNMPLMLFQFIRQLALPCELFVPICIFSVYANEIQWKSTLLSEDYNKSSNSASAFHRRKSGLSRQRTTLRLNY